MRAQTRQGFGDLTSPPSSLPHFSHRGLLLLDSCSKAASRQMGTCLADLRRFSCGAALRYGGFWAPLIGKNRYLHVGQVTHCRFVGTSTIALQCGHDVPDFLSRLRFMRSGVVNYVACQVYPRSYCWSSFILET